MSLKYVCISIFIVCHPYAGHNLCNVKIKQSKSDPTKLKALCRGILWDSEPLADDSVLLEPLKEGGAPSILEALKRYYQQDENGDFVSLSIAIIEAKDALATFQLYLKYIGYSGGSQISGGLGGGDVYYLDEKGETKSKQHCNTIITFIATCQMTDIKLGSYSNYGIFAFEKPDYTEFKDNTNYHLTLATRIIYAFKILRDGRTLWDHDKMVDIFTDCEYLTISDFFAKYSDLFDKIYVDKLMESSMIKDSQTLLELTTKHNKFSMKSEYHEARFHTMAIPQYQELIKFYFQDHKEMIERIIANPNDVYNGPENIAIQNFCQSYQPKRIETIEGIIINVLYDFQDRADNSGYIYISKAGDEKHEDRIDLFNSICDYYHSIFLHINSKIISTMVCRYRANGNTMLQIFRVLAESGINHITYSRHIDTEECIKTGMITQSEFQSKPLYSTKEGNIVAWDYVKLGYSFCGEYIISELIKAYIHVLPDERERLYLKYDEDKNVWEETKEHPPELIVSPQVDAASVETPQQVDEPITAETQSSSSAPKTPISMINKKYDEDKNVREETKEHPPELIVSPQVDAASVETPQQMGQRITPETQSSSSAPKTPISMINKIKQFLFRHWIFTIIGIVVIIMLLCYWSNALQFAQYYMA